MKKQNTRCWQTALPAAIAAVILLCAFGSTFAQSKAENNNLSLTSANQNLWLTNLVRKLDVTNLQQDSLFAANSSLALTQPKPDFSAMEKWFEIVKYEYGDPATDTQLYIWAKRIKEGSPAGFVMEFRDSDGVLIGSPWAINDYTLNSTPVGKTTKTYCGTPSESEFKRVATATVVRIVV